MAIYRNPYSVINQQESPLMGLSRGIQSGVGLANTYQQMKALRDKKAQEDAMRASMGEIDYSTGEYSPEVLAMMEADPSFAQQIMKSQIAGQIQGKFAPNKFQKDVDSEGYFIGFDPRTNTVSRVLDKNGKPVKKGSAIKEINDGKTITLLSNITGELIASYPVNIEPSQDPKFKGRQAEEIEKGKAKGIIETAEEVREAKGEVSPKEKKSEGRRKVRVVTSSLRNTYGKLRDIGGVVDVEKSSIDNIITSIKKSGLGQKAQKSAGSLAQSYRDQIDILRTYGLLAIKEAADLGTTSMNTAAEMEKFLKLATNPDVDFQTNMVALETFEEMFAKEIGNKQSSKPVGMTDEKWNRLQELRKKKAEGNIK